MKTVAVMSLLAMATVFSAKAPPAHAEEIRVLSSVGIQAVVEALAPEFERTTGHELSLQFDLASAQKTKIEGGEAVDVAILTPPLLDDLIAKGLVASETRTVIARVGLATNKPAEFIVLRISQDTRALEAELAAAGA